MRFEEQFPSLKGKGTTIARWKEWASLDAIAYSELIIEENCLDKEKVQKWLMNNFDNDLLFKFQNELGL